MHIQVINLMSYQNALAMYEQLKIDFPKCFFPLGNERPLKVGIYQDLVKLPSYSAPQQKKALKVFLTLYTSSIFYRAALLVPEAIRIDLNGYEVGRVTAKAKYIAKTHCNAIFWELDNEGYEHQKTLAKKYKKLGQYTPEVIASLFPPLKKADKPKKMPTTLPKKAAAPESNTSTQLKHPMTLSQPKASSQPKKPVKIVFKRKRLLLENPSSQ